MKHRFMHAFGLIAAGALALGAGPVDADTIANGPYYATPSWDQTLPGSTRFIVLSNFVNAAVLDRETGLVWQRSPASVTGIIWAQAVLNCMNSTTGGRQGWRLPTIHELESLKDETVALPAGHPFTGVSTDFFNPYVYWSTTTYPGASNFAMDTQFLPGSTGAGSLDKSMPGGFAWCVRGGLGVDSNPY